MIIMGVTNHFLIVFEAHFIRGNCAYCCQPDQKPIAEEIIVSNKEITTAVSLSRNVLRFSSKYFFIPMD